ncbi:hypothetical protein JRO89_XS06G0112900 [Xanthoceras sorbifolium]|uniref:Uncharacterized protein n=1 Tax=Xanthoceras sorbifolium TaxID=99658 RepID=A0ABQ8HY35_9ROSI|nr:hypothetical protein JRO89_XS06G0112900 [Xanthoceras sorbifolium]
MERKSCCGSSSYVPSSCVSTVPKKETIAVTTPPKKEEDVKPQITTTNKEDSQVGVLQTPRLRSKLRILLLWVFSQLRAAMDEQVLYGKLCSVSSFFLVNISEVLPKLEYFKGYVTTLATKMEDPGKVHSILCSFEEVRAEGSDLMTKIDEVVTYLNQEPPPSEETLAKFEAQLTDIFNKVESKLNYFCVQFSITFQGLEEKQL